LRVPQRHYSYVAPVTTVETKSHIKRPETQKQINRRVATTSTHTVKRGETLISIAKKYNTGASTLARLNGFSTWKTQVRIGQKLKVSSDGVSRRAVASAPKAKKVNSKPITYTVKSGDNLTNLAKVFNLSINEIKSANKLKRNTLFVGQKLSIPGTKKGVYTVKRGDHLIGVSKNFNTPLEALIK